MMMKVKHRENLTLLGLLSITILTGVLLALPKASADDTVTNVSITVSAICSITTNTNDNTAHSATVDPGTYESNIGKTTIKTICNDSNGFSIYAIGYTNEEYGNTTLRPTTLDPTQNSIITGTATTAGTPDTSNWAMKISAVSGTYVPTIGEDTDGLFSNYHKVPSTFTKVATKSSGTDITTGSSIEITYSAYIAGTQPADLYNGKVKFTMVHPATEQPLQPQTTQSGQICYYANGSNVEGTMGCQNVSSSVTLLASNFSRTGYGFAGWSDKFDYSTGAHFYGPNETITINTSDYSGTNNGLSLYAVWVKSAGSLQDTSKVATLCGTGQGSLTAAVYDNKGDSDESTWSINAGLSSISALTDSRDNQTYAIAKLTDGNCWMIENLRLADTHQEGANTVATTLTTANTNNPLNDATNVTLKHNYTDTTTYNTLSATSNVAYNADTAPNGWCTTDSSACDDQSRLRTDNTANRATGNPRVNSGSMYSYGNYYNWYSATAGNGTYSKTSGVTNGDLCPAGWHLPYGGSGTGTKGGNASGGFNYLANSMVATTSNATNSNKHRTFPNNFVYSGYVYGASVDYRGSSGGYWSSTAYNSGNAYGLGFGGYSVYPGTNFLVKYYGRTVRCTASPSA